MTGNLWEEVETPDADRVCQVADCPKHGQPTAQEECPICGRTTTALLTESGAIRDEMIPDEERDVVEARLIARRRRQMVRGFAVVVVISVLGAVVTRYTVVYAVAAALNLQGLALAVIGLRRRSPTFDEMRATRQRVVPVVRDLCQRAGCPEPTVSSTSLVPLAAVVRRKSEVRLLISPTASEALDDGELRAIVAHEIGHVMRDDAGRIARTNRIVLLAVYGILFVLTLSASSGSWAELGLPLVFALPAVRILVIPLGFTHWPMEYRADRTSATLGGDAEVSARALERLYALRRSNQHRLLRSPIVRALLVPFSLPATTHPRTSTRIVRLRALGRPTASGA